MKNEKFVSELSTYFKRHMGCRNKRAFRLLSVAEETETMQGKIQG
jgi:hypothetical protein